MTVVLAVLLAVAVVVAVVLAWAARARSQALRQAEAEASNLRDRMGEAVRGTEEADQQRRAAEVRAQAAEGRVRIAEQRAADAERKAGEAERRVGEAMRRAVEAERAGAESGAARAVWELERLRVEREWLDVVGPGVPLPVEWDGTIAAVIATELSVIREVIGTPSDLSVQSPPRPASPASAAVSARVGVEMLRTLARSGEEMGVTVDREAVTVTQPLYPGDPPPEVAALAEVARSAGLELTLETVEGRSTVRLSLA